MWAVCCCARKNHLAVHVSRLPGAWIAMWHITGTVQAGQGELQRHSMGGNLGLLVPVLALAQWAVCCAGPV